MSGAPAAAGRRPAQPGAEEQLAAIRDFLGRSQAAKALAALDAMLPAVPHGHRYAFRLGRKALPVEKRLAEAAFRVAIGVEPDFDLAYVNLAQALWAQQARREAVEVLRVAASRIPASLAVQARLGDFLLNSGGAPEEAEAAFRAAIALGGTDVAHRFGLAEAIRLQRRIREALAEFRLARAAAEELLPEDSTGRVANLFRRFHLLMFGEAEELKRRDAVAPSAAVRPGAAEGDPSPGAP